MNKKIQNSVIIDNNKFGKHLKKIFYFVLLYRYIKFYLLNYFKVNANKYYYLFYNSKIKINLNRIISNTIYLNPNKNVINKNTVIYEEEETNLILKVIKNNNYFFDIGAHQGYYSFIASKYCKKIFAFEPLKKFYKEIEYHIKLNNIDNIRLHNYGFGDGEYLEYGNYLEIKKFKTIKLSDFIKNQNLENQNILFKIDVDGFENSLIQGFKEIINTNNYSIVIDYYQDRIEADKYKNNILDLIDLYADKSFLFNKQNFNRIDITKKYDCCDQNLERAHSEGPETYSL